MRKIVRNLTVVILTVLLINPAVPVTAYEAVINQPVVRYVKDAKGDKICFEVEAKIGESTVRHRTIGWTIAVNSYKIIYKYPEIAGFDFTFYMKDIENEFKRQYGESSSTYGSVKKILYETGGTIYFDAIKTVVKNRIVQGSIVDNPIYGKSNSYNYTGRVYTTLVGIQNAENWNYTTKSIDLPKYYGISYKFAKQPSINGKFTIKYLDTGGKSIGSDQVQTCVFGLNSSYKYSGSIKGFSGYTFKGWKIYNTKRNVIKSGTASSYECTLTEALPEAVLEATYEAKIEATDLYISDITPAEYKEKTKVITIVTVGNIGRKDYGPNSTVGVEFTVNGKVYTREVDIGAGKEIIVPFVWTTPAAGKVTMEAEINYDRKHVETNYSNNKLTKTADIKLYKADTIGDTPKVTIIPVPQVENNNYIEWKEWRFVKWGTDGKAVYEQKTFWVKLQINAKPNVTYLKSGYGFFMDVTTKVTTNYDRAEFIIPPQRTQVYVPEKQFKSFFELDIKSGGGAFVTNWQVPVNSRSLYEYRKHYVPIWFPDRIYYEMNVIVVDSYCPGGILNSVAIPNIYINGNMYEDDANGGYKLK